MVKPEHARAWYRHPGVPCCSHDPVLGKDAAPRRSVACTTFCPRQPSTLFIQEAFSQFYTPIIYIIGFIALWFHLNHGIWSMFQSIGWDNQVWICRLKKVACWWSSIVVALFIIQAIVFTVKAHDNFYKTDETLRQQYKEMLVPMFEKDFGPDAASAITADPFDQMKQMIKGTLSQMEAPEAQSLFRK